MLSDHIPIKPQQLAGPLMLATLAIAAHYVLTDNIAYDRAALETGELWRLFTGNLAHTNDYHLMMNLGGLLAVWLLQGDEYHVRDFALVTLVSALGVSLGLYFLSPGVTWYVGLSGVLHGVFAWRVVTDLAARHQFGLALAFGLILKLGLEQQFGAAENTEKLIGQAVIVDAHLYGALVGVVTGLIISTRRQRVSDDST